MIKKPKTANKPESVRIKTTLPNKWVIVSASPCIGISLGAVGCPSVEYVSISATLMEITDPVKFMGRFANEDSFRNPDCWRKAGVWEAKRKTIRWDHRTMVEAAKAMPAAVALAREQLAAKGLLAE